MRRRSFNARMRRITPEPRPDLTRLGEGAGGWMVPEDMLFDGMVCWSAGTRDDVTFDLALIKRYGARVRCFDAAPRPGSLAESLAATSPLFSLHEVTLAAENARPRRTVGRAGAGRAGLDPGPQRRLDTLAGEFGEGAIDLLRLDLGGREYEVLEAHHVADLGVQILCVELHHGAPAVRAANLLRSLRAQGYRLVHRTHPAALTLGRTGTRAGPRR